MIKTFSTVNELNKVLRKQLILQSELPEANVRNGLSTYGETLEHLLAKQTYEPYEAEDSFIVFELKTRMNESDVSYTNDDDSVTYDRSYEFTCFIYGNSSADVANKIAARFRTEKVRTSLYDQGVYLEKVNDPISFNEYKNEMMWLRTDVSILISCEFKINQVSEDDPIGEISDLEIFVKE